MYDGRRYSKSSPGVRTFKTGVSRGRHPCNPYFSDEETESQPKSLALGHYSWEAAELGF